jgi:thiamine-phosphate pyrophosphorylase
MYLEALELRRLSQGATFLINDRLDIALAVEADGVHLGQKDMPYGLARRILGKKKIIGLTVHNLKEAQEAEKVGADYIGVSPVFPTNTKGDAGRAVGIELIAKIKRRVALPLVAIGGINLSNARKVICAGADGLCAISAVLTKKNVRAEIEKYQRLFKDA